MQIQKISLGGNVSLRILKESDVSEEYVSWLNDPEVVQFTEARHMRHTMESQRSYVSTNLGSEGSYLWGIFLSDSLVGTIRLARITDCNESATVAFLLGSKKHWGKGITTRCVKAIEEIAKKDLGLKKLKAGYYLSNKGSARVFQKLGWKVEGIQVGAPFFRGEERIDCVRVCKILEMRNPDYS